MLTDPSAVRSTPHTQLRIDAHDLILLLYFTDLLTHAVCNPSGDHILTYIRQLQRCPAFMNLLPEATTLLAVHGARLDRFLNTHSCPPARTLHYPGTHRG